MLKTLAMIPIKLGKIVSRIKRKLNFLIMRIFLALLAFSLTSFNLSSQGLELEMIEVNGKVRQFGTFFPPGFSPTSDQALPLVINFHGSDQNFLQQAVYTDFQEIAVENNFIVVYPDSDTIELGCVLINGTDTLDTTCPTKSWDAYFNNPLPGNQDLAFIDELIDHMHENFNIDLSRVYATGMSNGGYMSFELACLMSDRIAAIASVAGSMGQEQFPTCNPDRAVPVMMFHGSADWINPAAGISPNPVPTAPHLSTFPLDSVIEYWVMNNGCALTPDVYQIYNKNTTDGIPLLRTTETTVTMSRYTDCDDASEVVFNNINGGVHAWASAPDVWVMLGPPNPQFPRDTNVVTLASNKDIIASQEIWNFFRRFSHPNPRPVDITSSDDSSTSLIYDLSLIHI